MSSKPTQILLIEDVPKYARLMREMLTEKGSTEFEIHWVGSMEEGLVWLSKAGMDVVLLDLALTSPDSALQNFLKTRNAAPHIPIIVLSGIDDERLAVRAMQEGAQDYLVKGELNQHILVRSIRYAIERKKTETALLAAEEKYRSIFEHIVEGIFQTTPSGQYVSANPALARIYGYDSPEEMISTLTNIGRDLYVDPGRREVFVRLMEENDVVSNFESKIYRKDRSIIWISENVRAVKNHQGKVVYYEGTVEDITARKLSEENLRNSEALYHSLVETIPQNIFRKNLAEQFTFANQRFCQTLGRTLEEIIGKTDFDFFPPELAAKYQKDDHVILETGKTLETIEEHQPPGGEKLYVNVVKTPLYDASGQIIGLQGIFWDITERKRAEERIKSATLELTRSREQLRLKNEQLSDDLKMAREIQSALLPQTYPAFPRSASPENSMLRFTHRYFPAEDVGGDFFNIRALSDTKAAVFICDVMGHGVRSALVTAIMRALVEELAEVATDPAQLMTKINRDLRAILKQTGNPMYTTAFYLVADLEKKELAYANAGHPPPLLVHRASRTLEQLRNQTGKSCPALGLMDDTTYTVNHTRLSADDLVILYTDGIFDIETDSEIVSLPWLCDQILQRDLTNCSVLFDELLAAALALSPEGKFVDDVCLVATEVNPALPF